MRGSGDDGPPAATELEERDALAARLADLGARGELVLYEDGCRARVLALPSLDQEESTDCAPGGPVSPDGSLVARCVGERTEIRQAEADVLVRDVPGCPAAWLPDGVLTVAVDRAVVRCPESCARTLIPRRELERAARLHPSMPDVPSRVRVLVDGIAWLSRTRAAVLLSIRIGRLSGKGALSAIAFFRDGRLDDARPYFRSTGGRLGASPRGTYVTQTPDVLLRPDGTQVTLPPFLTGSLAFGHAFAWSPDERFVAVASRHAVHVLEVASLERFDDNGFGLRSVTIPYRAADLAWR